MSSSRTVDQEPRDFLHEESKERLQVEGWGARIKKRRAEVTW